MDVTQQPESDSNHRYRTGDVTKILGVSRASLVYYEQMGLVTPVRSEATGAREYHDSDIFDLIGFCALNNMGLSAKQVTSMASQTQELFDEQCLERYTAAVTQKIAYDEALRESIDRMRRIRLRARTESVAVEEWVERSLFIEDGGEGGYLGFKSTSELEALVANVPIAGFGILFDIDLERHRVAWRWGRTLPARLATAAGIQKHYPVQVGGCTCLTRVAAIADERTPLGIEFFEELHAEAHDRGLTVVGSPFVPYIFPPHPGTPFEVCLPVEQ